MTDPALGFGGSDGTASAVRTSPTAVVALVTAIASFFVLPIVGGLAALLLARAADREIAGSGGRIAGADVAKAARVVGLMNVVFYSMVVIGVGILTLLVFE